MVETFSSYARVTFLFNDDLHYLQIRNPSPSFKYATVEKSSVETYFRRQVELSSMYLFMKDKNYKNAEDAIDALKRE